MIWSRPLLGAAGERAAARALVARGFTILARRFVAAGAEIDLVACRPGEPVVHFVEVKTRRTGSGFEPGAAIDAGKRRRIERAAAAYLARHRLTGVRGAFGAALVRADGWRLEVDLALDAWT